ncbi:hypothetical protein K7432_011418 [Basidiobolus ranarum]|uniref:Uncharacterized protein n=1 Tax=Basidiobolus ranarum TaxID=34480 RepID=A0ABR2VU12_9FUNG
MMIHHFFQSMLALVLSTIINADYIIITSPTANATISPGQQLTINLAVKRADLAAIQSLNVRLLTDKEDILWMINYPQVDVQGEWRESFTWPVRYDLAEGNYTLNAYSNASYFNGRGRSFIMREANLTLAVTNLTLTPTAHI